MEFFKDGDAWNKWVFSLGSLLAEQGHHILTARSHSKPSRSKHKQFVRLIKALQKRPPQEFVQQRSSEEALAKAVQRALHSRGQDS